MVTADRAMTSDRDQWIPMVHSRESTPHRMAVTARAARNDAATASRTMAIMSKPTWLL